jgi:hypothetical protein
MTSKRYRRPAIQAGISIVNAVKSMRGESLAATTLTQCPTQSVAGFIASAMRQLVPRAERLREYASRFGRYKTAQSFSNLIPRVEDAQSKGVWRRVKLGVMQSSAGNAGFDDIDEYYRSALTHFTDALEQAIVSSHVATGLDAVFVATGARFCSRGNALHR